MKKKTVTKHALLASILAMVLCVTMLVGTTFAWFTDTASAKVNQIKSGKLDVMLEYATEWNENGSVKTWTDAEGKTLDFVKAKNAPENEAILWEPGCTYKLPELRIRNNGNLALKYKVVIKGVEGDTGLASVIDWEIENMSASKDGTTGEYYLLNANDTAELTISGHMQETAGNDYMGKSIDDVSIMVYATQKDAEYDSTTNQYDKDAPLDFVQVGTAAELKTVFANAADGEAVNVSLTGDIDLGEDKTLMIVDENSNIGNINIQANGHTIKNAVAGARVLQMAKSDTERTITITGAKIVSEGAATSNENRGVQIFSVNNATINLVNCEIEMKSKDYSYPVKIGGTSENLTINITGCTLTGANCIESFGTNCTVNITDCVLNSNYAPNATYCGNGIQDKNGTNNTYNITNTTFNGTNAQPWETSSTTVINDLGGNVYNTTRTTE